MGATNRIDSLDPMIRRNGRFDKEIAMGIPDEAARIHILKNLTLSLRLDPLVDFRQLGKMTPGFVGADLESVVKEAALLCINRTFCQSNSQVEKMCFYFIKINMF
jgi:ribosome biogenesis ATPase